MAGLQYLAALQGMADLCATNSGITKCPLKCKEQGKAQEEVCEIDNVQGPSDKKSDFGKSCIYGYSVLS